VAEEKTVVVIPKKEGWVLLLESFCDHASLGKYCSYFLCVFKLLASSVCCVYTFSKGLLSFSTVNLKNRRIWYLNWNPASMIEMSDIEEEHVDDIVKLH
jgi:hypothetical protein